jgi:hypothetical protein
MVQILDHLSEYPDQRWPASDYRVPTPWAELFHTFEDRGDGVLNQEEQAACRELENESPYSKLSSR